MTVPALRTLLASLAIGLSVEGCIDVSISGHSSSTDLGSVSSTGSTTSGAATTTAGTSTGGSSSGSSSAGATSSSTGGASSTSTGSSTGTSGWNAQAILQPSQAFLEEVNGDGISNSADFNGDGLLDVVAVGFGELYVFDGLADGGLSTPVSIAGPQLPLVAADVNGDGLPDLVGTSQTGIVALLNVGGQLTTEKPLIQDPQLPDAIAVGDLEQNGIPDVVDCHAAGPDYDVDTFHGYGDGQFAPAIHAAMLPAPEIVGSATLFLSDLNRDGFPDIVAVAAGSTQVAVLLHLVDGGYQTSLYDFPGPVTAAAVPRPDAAPDLIAGYDQDAGSAQDGVVQLLINAGDGTFSMGPSYDVPNLANVLAVSDFNGDSLPDVAVSAGGCYQVGAGACVLFGDSDGGFGSPQSCQVPSGAIGQLTPMGPVSNPHALAASVPCGNGALVIFGDASLH